MSNSNRVIHLDIDQKIVNVQGEALKESKGDVTLRMVLIGTLISENGCSDPVKNWKTARNLQSHLADYSTNETEIEWLESIIKKSPDMPMVKGQVLEMLMNATLNAMKKQNKEEILNS